MEINNAWLKFLITGNPKDYLKYKQLSRENDLFRGEETAYNDRWSCDKGDKYTG